MKPLPMKPMPSRLFAIVDSNSIKYFSQDVNGRLRTARPPRKAS